MLGRGPLPAATKSGCVDQDLQGVLRDKQPLARGERVATFVADPQQHSPKSAGMAPQPYAAAMASHMVARGLGQILDWDFQ